jgi:hypothetical protein
MRRNKAPGGDRVLSGPKRVVRIVPILLAGCVGYLLGSAHLDVFRATDLSAAEAIAQRFPQDWRSASLAAATGLRTAAVKLQTPKSANAAGASAANTLATATDAQSGLLNPEPTVAQANLDAAAPATIQTASADGTATLPVSAAQNPPTAVSQPQPSTRVAALAPHHPVNERPGYMLNDAQIASIKQRLHLTPDQEQMWPAVEAALRNIAYTHTQQARRRGATTQTAEVDPNAVQGLKSAAVPLILSFNSEQKEEVRNLVHVMGLDQLASQF